jgi:hypothetical protein
MPKIQPIVIPPAATVEDLRQSTVKQMNTLARTVAQSSNRTEDMDLGNNRITSVGNPVNAADAVNLSTLERAIKNVHGATTAVKTFFGSAFNPPSDGGASLGTTALRWLNLFVKSGLNVGGGSAPNYLIEALGASGSQIHFNSADTDAGGWLMSLTPNDTYLMNGVAYNGVAFVAKATTAAIIELGGGGALKFYANSGLTAGVTYSPTLRFQIDASGNITTVAAITASGNINTTGGVYEANGTAGETGPVTLTYLTGTPGSGQSSKTVTFNRGIETSHT